MNESGSWFKGMYVRAASQVDLRVRQLLAANTDSPLGVPKRGEYQDAERCL